MRLIIALTVVLLTTAITSCAKHQPCDQYCGAFRDLCLLRMHGVPVMRAGQTVKII